MYHLSQEVELPLGHDGAPPQVGDVNVVWGCRHGRLQVVIVAERPAGHTDGELHPAHPGPFESCRGNTIAISQNSSEISMPGILFPTRLVSHLNQTWRRYSEEQRSVSEFLWEKER